MTTERSLLADAFLSDTAWAGARRAMLAGDASNRRYDRLTHPDTGQTAVFMDAPPDRGEDVRPFVAIARHLSGIGLSPPDILAEDAENGFLLLEDLGDDLFARLIVRDPGVEDTLYAAAVDLLLHLHRAPLPAVDSYSPSVMADLATLAFDKYRDPIMRSADPAARRRFIDRFEDILADLPRTLPVLVLRDYHAENLIWLPDRDGPARVGLLDFQDALAGHPAYDLVSLLQDARRDVPAQIELAMLARYIDSSGQTEHDFRTAYAVLGAQRNLRILGVFGRLATDYGKPHYIDLIPRVWAHLMTDLEHPALASVSDLLRDSLPAPTPDALARLRP